MTHTCSRLILLNIIGKKMSIKYLFLTTEGTISEDGVNDVKHDDTKKIIFIDHSVDE